MAVEEKELKSTKTDASLYNGLPFDTGSMCQSGGVTSSTLSIKEDKDGVSVENIHKTGNAITQSIQI